VSTPRFSVRRCRRFPSLGWLGVMVLVVGLVAAGCGKNPVDKRRTAEMAADPILVAPDEDWALISSTNSPGGVAFNGQPSQNTARTRWVLEGQAEPALLRLLADHAEQAGWTIASVYCGSLVDFGTANVEALRFVDGAVAGVTMFVTAKSETEVEVQMTLTMWSVDQEGITPRTDLAPRLVRSGTCLDPSATIDDIPVPTTVTN